MKFQVGKCAYSRNLVLGLGRPSHFSAYFPLHLPPPHRGIFTQTWARVKPFKRNTSSLSTPEVSAGTMATRKLGLDIYHTIWPICDRTRPCQTCNSPRVEYISCWSERILIYFAAISRENRQHSHEATEKSLKFTSELVSACKTATRLAEGCLD